MDIQIAVLCDAATDNNGKLNILGTFDTIYTSQLPATHPQCSIAVRMTFNKVEDGTHTVKLNFVDEDGKSVMPPIEIPVEVAVPDETIFLSRNFMRRRGFVRPSPRRSLLRRQYSRSTSPWMGDRRAAFRCW